MFTVKVDGGVGELSTAESQEQVIARLQARIQELEAANTKSSPTPKSAPQDIDGDSWGMSGGSGLINRWLSQRVGEVVTAKECFQETHARSSAGLIAQHFKSLCGPRKVNGRLVTLCEPVGGSFSTVMVRGL